VQEELERQTKGLVYNIAPLKAISPLASPLSFECDEGKRFTEGNNATIKCVEEIEESARLLLERLQICTLKRRMKVAMGPSQQCKNLWRSKIPG